MFSRNIAQSASVSVLALGSTMWLSGAMLESTQSDENAGYELVGGFEMWESAILRGGDLELTGHIEPAWEGYRQGDELLCEEQPCDEGSTVEAAVNHLDHHMAGVVGSNSPDAPDADAIIELVQMWGVCPTATCGPDLTGDGLVEAGDLMQLLFNGKSR